MIHKVIYLVMSASSSLDKLPGEGLVIYLALWSVGHEENIKSVSFTSSHPLIQPDTHNFIWNYLFTNHYSPPNILSPILQKKEDQQKNPL